jgi:WD40 repeat protein
LQDVVEEYKVFEGHEEDILSMDVYMKKSVVATGDYEGRICIWNVNSGEKKMCLYHRSDRCNLTSIQLQHMQHMHI